MYNFKLIQRGTFKKNATAQDLIGKEGSVDLDYMGSAEFQFGAIAKAYRRVMYNFDKYETIHTQIYTPEHEELLLFCRKDYATDVVQAVRDFINNPYFLKEDSELEKVPKAKAGDTSYGCRYSNFWWCIDKIEPYGDWMAFLEPQSEVFTISVNTVHKDWWLKMTQEERKEEFEWSIQ